MCGLFGWITDNKMDVNKLRVVADVLVDANDKRGGDSYGYWDGQTITRGLERFSKHVPAKRLAKAPIMLAHTRLATTGGVTLDNCHPFHVGEIIGAHNGMVSNHHALNMRYARQCSVDSEHIFHHLAAGLPLTEIEAYGAIVWRAASGDLFFGRFNAGVLSAALVKGGVIWSSDRYHLMSALKEAKLRASMFYTLKNNQAYGVTARGILRHKMLHFKECAFDWYGDWGWGTAEPAKPTARVMHFPQSSLPMTTGLRISDLHDGEYFSYAHDGHVWQIVEACEPENLDRMRATCAKIVDGYGTVGHAIALMHVYARSGFPGYVTAVNGTPSPSAHLGATESDALIRAVSIDTLPDMLMDEATGRVVERYRRADAAERGEDYSG